MSVEMHKVESSNIHSVGYDAAKKELHILFHKEGEVQPFKYIYKDVPTEIHRGIMEAESKGKFFHAHILKVFGFDKVPTD